MKRRVFVFSGAAAMMLPMRVLAQRTSTSAETSYTTELTGSVIELGDSGFTFGESGVENGNESVEVILDTNAGYIEFFPTIDDPAEFMESAIAEMQAQISNVEVVETGSFDDGAWALLHADLGGVSTALYRELQISAYPGYDLVVSFRCAVDAFTEVFNAFQLVTVDGFAPFLFMEDNDVLGLVAAIVPASTTTRTSRGSRTVTPTEPATNQTTRKSRTSSNTKTTNTTDTAYRDAVVEHRLEFQSSFVVFLTALGVLMDQSSTTQKSQTALEGIDAVVVDWLDYPDRAAELTAPSSESVLADLYETWCDEIAGLADVWQKARVSQADAEAIFTQIEVVLDADDALGAELGDPAAVSFRLLAVRRSHLRLA